MDPNSILVMIVMGAGIGALLGTVLAGDTYGWLFNSIAGIVGAIIGINVLSVSQIDMGPWMNAIMASAGLSTVTAMMLRS